MGLRHDFIAHRGETQDEVVAALHQLHYKQGLWASSAWIVVNLKNSASRKVLLMEYPYLREAKFVGGH